MSISSEPFDRAVDLHRLGQTADAERLYRRVLLDAPGFAPAMCNLASLLLDRQLYGEALVLLDRAHGIEPANPIVLNNLGNALGELGRRNEALRCYEEALKLSPGYASALSNRSNVLLLLGQPAEAARSAEQAVAIAPEHAAAHSNLGRALAALGRLELALGSLDRALQLRPDWPLGLTNRASLLLSLHRPEQALRDVERALQLAPKEKLALAAHGAVLRALQRFQGAIQAYEAALAVDGGFVAALCGRGMAALDLEDAERALASFERALELAPNEAEPHFGRGLALTRLDRPTEAAAAFARVLEIAPGVEYAGGLLLLASMQQADWQDCTLRSATIREALTGAKMPCEPFVLLTISDSPDEQLMCARRFVEERYRTHVRYGRHTRAQRESRLHVGYVSGDFGNHPVTHLLAGVFERHDRTEFEVTAFALRPSRVDGHARRLRAAFGRFIDVSGHTDADVARLARECEIDILIDLMGHTRGSRLGIFAHRAAPVQVNYLGYAGTLGAPYMDYILGDEVVIPSGQEAHYSEQVVRLPHCYLPNDDRREIGDRPSRAMVGLPEDAVVFCAFTNTYKINPPMYEVWMRLLREVPGSVLWLRAVGEPARANLLREAQRRGVGPERLIFAEHVASMSEHLARQALADLYLDTLPYNAHSTTCDALWAGVPVLTCAGRSFAARVAASALHAVGLPELVSESLEQYERVALQLAHERERLSGLRARLAANRARSPLFDTRSYTRALESALRHMHERARQGLPPAGFNVAELASTDSHEYARR
jgi:predicted O-linked N-acetylglucosamine transferase (SPINDLY family)